MLEIVEEHIQREIEALEEQRQGSVAITVGEVLLWMDLLLALLCLRGTANRLTFVLVVGARRRPVGRSAARRRLSYESRCPEKASRTRTQMSRLSPCDRCQLPFKGSSMTRAGTTSAAVSRIQEVLWD